MKRGALLFVIACAHAEPQVAPGPPIVADPDVALGTMDEECAALVAAITAYGECPNLEDGEKNYVRALLEAADQSFAAGKKANPDEQGQHAIAAACHKATVSRQHATERCLAGPRPKGDY